MRRGKAAALTAAMAILAGAGSDAEAMPVTPAVTLPRPPADHRPAKVSLQGPTRIVILALDSDAIQAGLGGDDAPRFVIPAVCAATKPPAPAAFGDDALAKPASPLVHPIQGGIVTDFGCFTGLVRYTLAKLGVRPQDARVVVTDPPLTPKTVREKMTQVMFDDVGVQAFYVTAEATLALYASGRTTGIVILADHDRSWVTPIYEGHVLPHSVGHIDLGHVDVLRRWGKLEASKSAPVLAEADLRAMDAALGYVAKDPGAEPATSVSFVLPNGRKVTVGTERFMAPEILFRPTLAGVQENGVATAVYDAIMKTDADIRKDLYGNVVVAGPAVHYPGLAARLTADVAALAPRSMNVKVIDPPESGRSVFVGASILVSLGTFQQMWITRAEYRASGPAIVDRKCM